MNIHGRKPIIEALKAGKEISKIYFRFGVEGEVLDKIRYLARKAAVPTVTLSKQKFDKLGNKPATTQGVIAFIEDIKPITLEELMQIQREQDPPFFIALDSITDPHNVGAIIRSAECAGAHGIILPTHDSAQITDTVVKTSAGAVSHMPIAKVENLAQALQKLKENNILIAGLDDDGDTDLFAFEAYIPVCIVVGSEGKGIRPSVLDACDIRIRIPMWGQIGSLNASVAAAVMLYEVRRKRV
jgi:23S rRNA (guanosine2251-2'-O)-methyltransferase